MPELSDPTVGNPEATANPAKMSKSERNMKKQVEITMLNTVTVDQYIRAIEADRPFLDQVDECRRFYKQQVIYIARTIGGQKLVPIIRKMAEGFRHPDGRMVETYDFDDQMVVDMEGLTRSELVRMKNDAKWALARQDIIPDGQLIQAFHPDDTGFASSEFIDRKRIAFNASCEAIHHPDRAKRANWLFQYEMDTVTNLLAKYEGKFPETAEEIGKGGVPYTRETEDREAMNQDEQTQSLKEEERTCGILTATCLYAPKDMQVEYMGETITIKRSQPFRAKIAGSAQSIIYLEYGEAFKSRWPQIQCMENGELVDEPFQPYVQFRHFPSNEGMRSPSTISLTKPYFEDMIFFSGLLRRNVELRGDPVLHGNFSGTKSIDAKNYFALDAKRRLENKKRTNFYLTEGKDLKVEWQKLSPDELPVNEIREHLDWLEGQIFGILELIMDDTSFKSDEKVGVRQFREQAQKSAVSFFQQENDAAFSMVNKIIGAISFTYPRKYTNRKIRIEEPGVKTSDGQVFTYERDFDIMIEQIDPEVLECKWEFPATSPYGALAVAATQEMMKLMIELKGLYPDVREIDRTLLNAVGKLSKAVSNNDGSFSSDKAMQELDAIKGRMEEEAQAMADEAMATDGGDRMPQKVRNAVAGMTGTDNIDLGMPGKVPTGRLKQAADLTVQ